MIFISQLPNSMIHVIHIWISVRIIYISPSKQQRNIVQLCTRSLFSFRQSALIVVLCYPRQGGHFLPFGGVAMSIMYTESVLLCITLYYRVCRTRQRGDYPVYCVSRVRSIIPNKISLNTTKPASSTKQKRKSSLEYLKFK